MYEPGASASFWGSNYPQLYAIKQKYDPSGLLDCWHCGKLRFNCWGMQALITGFEVGWKGKATPIASCYF